MPRHRSPRPLLGLWRRRTSLRPLHKGVLVSAALALVGAATGIALAAAHHAAPGPASGAQAGAQQTLPSASSTVRAPSPSRSSERRARPHGPVRSPAPSGTTSLAGSPTAPSLPGTAVPSPSLPSVEVSTSVPQTPSRSTASVDRTPPVTTASTVSTDNRTWVVSLGANEPASFECSLDGGGYEPCRATAVFGDLTPGHHTLAAQAVDRAGNADLSPARLTAQVNASPS